MTTTLYVHGDSPGAMVIPTGGKYGLVLADPPYALGKDPHHQYGRRQLRGIPHGDAFIQNDKDLSELAHVLPFMVRTLHVNGIAAIFGAGTKRLEMELLLAPHFGYVQSIQWDKGQPGMGYELRWATEDIYICAAHDPWDIPRTQLISPIRCPGVRDPLHPNQKPVKLLRHLIRWALPAHWYTPTVDGSPYGEFVAQRPPRLVQDPFAGVGSVAVAAICEGVDSISNESDPQWWPLAEKRIRDAEGREHHDDEQHTLALRAEENLP